MQLIPRHKFAIVSMLLLGIVMSEAVASATSARFSFSADRLGGTTGIYKDVKPGDVITGNMKLTMIDDVNGSFKINFESSLGDTRDAKSPLNMQNWVEFPKGSEFEIAQKENKDKTTLVPFKLTIPKEASPGDYEGLMIASLKPAANVKTSGAGVTMGAAVGVSIKMSVPGKRVHKLTLLSFKPGGFVPTKEKDKENDKKDLVLTFDYKAEGNSMLRPSANIVIKNTFGKEVYNETKIFSDIVPGRQMSQTVVIPDVDTYKGWLDTQTELTYSIVNISGAVEKNSYKSGKASVRIYTIPWLEIMAILLLILIGAGTLIYRSWKLRHMKANSSSYTVKNGETLQTLCSTMNVNPKDVIFVNKLSPPYFLPAGGTILIPNKKQQS